MTETNSAPDGIHDPAWRAALIARFRLDPRAMRIWSRQARDSTRLPDLFVACSNGMFDLAGVVIGGQGAPGDPPRWDMAGTFTLFDEQGAVLDVNGWLATELETVVHASDEEK